MINARTGDQTKLLILYDVPQHQNWVSDGLVSVIGMNELVKGIKAAGMAFTDISICCLSDDIGGKAQGYKDKADYISELIGTLAPNLLLIPSAKAFEKCMDIKGASKFYGKVLMCEKYKTKAITVPPHSILSYKPDMLPVIERTLQVVAKEMEFPEIVERKLADKKYTYIDTISKFNAFFDYYKNKVTRYAFDIESTSLQFNNGNTLSFQFSHKSNFGYFIATPIYGAKWVPENNWTPEEWEYIVKHVNILLEDDSKEKIGANIYFDLKFMHHEFGTKLVKENVTDVLIQSFLVEENRESHSLKFCAATLLEDAGDYDHPLELFKSTWCKDNKVKKKDFCYINIPLSLMIPYGCMDVDYTLQLADYFKVKLEEENQVEVFKDVSSYAWALAKIECNGWAVDLVEAERYKQELEERIAAVGLTLQELPEIKAAIAIISKQKLAKENEKRKTKLTELKKPVEFLVNSVAHKRLLFRDLLKFREVKKTKKKEFSTDKECFQVWAEEHPDVQSLQQIKQIEEAKKMLSTYVMAILNRNVKGRLHCSFRVCGAKTGRISATQPSMMNIAMHSSEAQKLKKCFVSAEGTSLVISDLSNAELRITAALSGDTVLCDAFKAGLDPHSNTAKEVFNLGCEVSEIKGSEEYDHYRQLAKTLGFAALYGAKCTLIAKKAGISNSEAQQHLDDYFKRHSGISQLLEDNLEYTREHGYALAVSGRRRRVPCINSDDEYLRERAERQANNFIVQSVASDGMLQSIVNMLVEIDEKQLPYKIINVIHDSVETEIPNEHVEEACKFISRHLSRFPKNVFAEFEMKCDLEVGKNWADMKEPDFGEFIELLEESDEDSEDNEDELEEAA